MYVCMYLHYRKVATIDPESSTSEELMKAITNSDGLGIAELFDKLVRVERVRPSCVSLVHTYIHTFIHYILLTSFLQMRPRGTGALVREGSQARGRGVHAAGVERRGAQSPDHR